MKSGFGVGATSRSTSASPADDSKGGTAFREAPGAPSRRLRVLIIVARDAHNPRVAGGDLHLSLLAQELSRAGHHVDVWCSAAPTLSRREEVEGVSFERLAPSRLLAPVVWARLLAGAASSYDLVVEEVIGGERTPFLAPLLSRRPCVGMWYQDNRPLFEASYGRPTVRIADLLQSFLLKVYRFRHLLTPSERTRQWLISSGVSADRIAVHHPKVLGEFEPTSRPTFRVRRNRFVCVGNYRPYKRFDEAVVVLERLRQDIPDAELVLIGREDDARYLGHLRQRVADSTAHDHISLRVNVTESEKFEALLNAKALTIHSPIEGFGWTIPEAGLCGVPTIANEGTPSEALTDGVNGVRVTRGDIDGYTATLKRWMSDESEWTRLSNQSVQFARRFVEAGLPVEIDAFFRRCAGRPEQLAPSAASSQVVRLTDRKS